MDAIANADIILDMADRDDGFVMTSCQGGRVAAIGYDGARWQLHIEYLGLLGRRGETWTYFEVSPETYGALVQTESKGIFVHDAISGKYHARQRRPFPPTPAPETADAL